LVVRNSCPFGLRDGLSCLAAKKAGAIQPKKKITHDAKKQMLPIAGGNASMAFAIPPSHVSRSITFSLTTNKITPSQSPLTAARAYPFFFAASITAAFLNTVWLATND
jgi:hypothetical protein